MIGCLYLLESSGFSLIYHLHFPITIDMKAAYQLTLTIFDYTFIIRKIQTDATIIVHDYFYHLVSFRNMNLDCLWSVNLSMKLILLVSGL